MGLGGIVRQYGEVGLALIPFIGCHPVTLLHREGHRIGVCAPKRFTRAPANTVSFSAVQERDGKTTIERYKREAGLPIWTYDAARPTLTA